MPARPTCARLLLAVVLCSSGDAAVGARHKDPSFWNLRKLLDTGTSFLATPLRSWGHTASADAVPQELTKSEVVQEVEFPTEIEEDSGEYVDGVVHFLFLVESNISHASVWRRFFDSARNGTWRGWVHCSHPEGCQRSGLFEQFPEFTQVETVKSTYCTDLVSPTVQLLRAALEDKTPVSEGIVEKFALMSDTSLPVKPFRVVHQTLVKDNLSDICMAPAAEWHGAHVDGIKLNLIKHSQWVVLNREHASALTNQWKPAKNWDTFVGWWNVPLKGGSFLGRERKVTAQRFELNKEGTYACTDEQAVFALLFGAFEPGKDGKRQYPGLGGGPVTTSPPAGLTAQGRCRTFVVFQNTDSLGNLTDGIMESIIMDRDTNTTFDPDTSHPIELRRLGRRPLAALRASPFLFARKFVQTPLEETSKVGVAFVQGALQSQASRDNNEEDPLMALIN